MGLIRLFLALVVAADHWRVIELVPLSIQLEDKIKFGFNAGYAVMFFYVISGFLITYTLTRNYSRDRGGTLAFYRNRFIRIFSLYWPMVLLTFLIIAGAWRAFVAADAWDKVTGLFLFGQDWNLAFATYPQLHWEAAIGGLHQAWTLAAELTFYVAAPFLLRSWKIAAALLVASFGVRAGFVATLGTGLDQIWTYHFIGSTFGFFLLGHLVCLAGDRWPMLASRRLGILLVACAFGAMTYAGSYVPFDGRRFWLSILLFTLALPGLFEATKSIRWMNFAGDLSYPIYLVHTTILIVLAPWSLSVALPLDSLPRATAGYISIVPYLIATILYAALVHRLVEMPVAHLMRWASRSDRRSNAEAVRQQ